MGQTNTNERNKNGIINKMINVIRILTQPDKQDDMASITDMEDIYDSKEVDEFKKTLVILDEKVNHKNLNNSVNKTKTFINKNKEIEEKEKDSNNALEK